MHTLRKAKLTFGMVTIDTNVATAVRDSEVHLARIHDRCKTRLGKPYFCPTCQEVVEPDHQVQAFPLDKDTLIPLDERDMASVQPERSGVIELTKFVNSTELNEMIMRTPYWLAPAQGKEAGKGYALLWHAMVQSGDIALGMTTLWGKEHPVCIEAREQGLVMWMLAQIDDMVTPDFIIPSVDAKELELTGMLLTAYQGGLSGADFDRPARAKLDALVKRKMKGQKVTPVEQMTPTSVPDVMEAIRASIKVSKPKRQKVKA